MCLHFNACRYKKGMDIYMKKSTIGVTIILMILIVCLVGFYAFLSGRAKTEATEAIMTPIQLALNRDLEMDYPATVKEVVKYYSDLEKCFYNEECTEEEIELLGMQARGLYDAELLTANEVGTYLVQLKQDIQSFREAKRRINSIAVSASTNVTFFSEDGYDFAKIYAGYSISDAGKSVLEGRVYLLRRDEDRHWKIYGWEKADQVNAGSE